MVIISAITIIHNNLCIGQNFDPAIIPDTSIWIFAHKQLAGDIIDTLYAGQNSQAGTEIWYHGEFYNRQVQLVGHFWQDENYSKIWYASTTDTSLIYDLSLEDGDYFKIKDDSDSIAVDTVFQFNNRRIVQLDYLTGWNEKLRFIEGVGPNTTLAWIWEDPGFLNTYLVCAYNDDENIYHTSNESFSNCSLIPSGLIQTLNDHFRVYPNPFSNELFIECIGSDNSENVEISIMTITGISVFKLNIKSNVGSYFLRPNLKTGIYILTYKTDNIIRTEKILKR